MNEKRKTKISIEVEVTFSFKGKESAHFSGLQNRP